MRESVTILGGGPVGLAAALVLARTEGAGKVRVVEAGRLVQREAESAPIDLRVVALSPGTRRLLESLEVWHALRAARCAPVTRMEVRGDQPDSLLELGLREPLAWIVEHRELTAALAGAVVAQGIEVIEGARAERWVPPLEEGAASRLEVSGRVLEQGLIVGADGAHSWLRRQAGLAVQERDYDSLGVVANFRCRIPHHGVARQWFRGPDVLAWLPLPGDQVSIVWSLPRAEGEALCALPVAEFSRRVSVAGMGQDDLLERVSGVAAFPLRRILAPASTASGLILLGDAAHAIHPLAGQGVNLGFGDVACLSDHFSRRSPLQGAGTPALLRRIERARREEVVAMAVLTDRLKSLFESRTEGLVRLRNAGLSWVNRRDALKRAMMRAAMG